MVRSLILGFWFTAAAAQAADTAVVFMYHRFGEIELPTTNVETQQFEAHLDYLDDEGFAVVSLGALIDALTGGDALPENAVVITIDDAYRSVYHVAHPRLRSRGFPYTVFVSSDGVDDGLQAYMTWDQMRRLAREGATFANHGASHTSLISPPSDGDHEDWARDDIERGLARLREELEPEERAFAYPYGEFNENVIDWVEALGYRIAFGQHSGAVGPMSRALALPRYPINESYGAIDDFRTRARSLPLPVQRVSPADNQIETRLPLLEIDLAGGAEGADYSGIACFVGGQGQVSVDWPVPNERFATGPEKPLTPGRHRINCTAPAGDGRYYWYSHPWFVVR